MRLWLGLVAACALAACSKSPQNNQTEASPIGAAKIDAAYLTSGGDGSDWPAVGYNYNEQRYSPLTRINDSNVEQLGIAWFADLPDARGQEATPVVVDGTMYLTGPWSKVFAYDAATGKKLWEYDPKVPREKGVEACCDVVNRGVAVWKGKLFVGTIDGRLIALDAITGAQLWSTQTTDPAKPYTITGAPRVVKNMVLIGNGGAEFGVRGYVTAYDVNNGAKKWRFYTVPNAQGQPDGEPSDAVLKTATKTWSADGQWKQSGGGGTVWDAIVYDAELDQLYLGVGNGNPWNHGVRSQGIGDNLFLSSIVALKPETGEYLWHYQETPGESWDYTATQPIILADLKIGDRVVKALMQAPKNGFFFVIDRVSGKLIGANPFVKNINWATGYDMATGRPKENPAARFYQTGKPFLASPAPIGAHSWQPMSYSPKTGLVYIPAQDIGFAYLPPLTPEDAAPYPIGFNTGANMSEGGMPRDAAFIKGAIAATKGALVAFDPVTGKEKWRADYTTPWNGGTMATAGNLVFQGTALGEFRAYAADTGKQLWSLPVQSGVMAGASTFLVKGEQYVAFTTGRGGAWPLTAGYAGGAYNRVPNVSRLIVLKLGGKGVLPALPAQGERTLTPPPSTGNPAQIAQGKALYGRFCQVCHGDSVVSGGVTPDLRHSGVLADTETWKGVVIDGMLKDNGMASFAKVLDAPRADLIRLYVIDQANWAAKNTAAIEATRPALAAPATPQITRR
ncbi:PQQ-dependent dehydrogenase, methanol/ethanol family [Sphingomonas cavernae]|uniref:PQQ-dependent dehydrogenase, methanol/ethanol family n=1 Tax=Sphingomonas cavernae TaxID=2320861 RepID=A0A418WKY6_9SPHN|nr:PQQ-dependent dehydrogenase, methanol/ethanol family [Sphingomonas cavernae]RJF90707.1 PQQ-dependent dehydrogenase, methanol/ethanol family [Sphingomonas cavernae]